MSALVCVLQTPPVVGGYVPPMINRSARVCWHTVQSLFVHSKKSCATAPPVHVVSVRPYSSVPLNPPNLYHRHVTSFAFVDELRVITAVIVCVASTTPAPPVHVVEPI